jgi:hypothetical protein
VSTLSDYLNDHIPPTWRKPQVVEALHGVIDRATVYKYLAGNHPRNPPEAVLQAFARVLPGASVVELRAAARVPIGAEAPWVPTVEANRLNAGQRQALDLFIKATVGSADEVSGTTHLSLPLSAPKRGRPQRRSPDALEPDQRSQVLDEVDKLRRIGRTDLADAVLEALELTSNEADPARRSRRP